MRRGGCRVAILLALLVVSLAAAPAARADPRAAAAGHHKKVVGATLIAVGSLLDAATTALTFTGLARGGWSLAPASATDTALLWSGVAGNFVLDSVLTVGIVIYCDGGEQLRRAQARP
jgi:hypothetical protein